MPARRHLAPAVLSLLLLASTPALPGGDAGSPDDKHDDNSLRFFGFVRDMAGKGVPGAKVTADVKGIGALVAHSDATGAYRVPVPGLGGQLNPANVSISCTKDGYKQARVLTRTPLNRKPLTAVEVECRLQPIKGR